MAEKAIQLAQPLSLKQWAPFAIKAIASLGIIFLVAHVLPIMPPFAAGICWAIMSAAVALGIAYPYIIRKLINRHEYQPGGRLFRLNDGRTIRLIASFVAAAVLVAGLLLEAARWNALEWAIAVLAIPVFIASCTLIRKTISKEFREEFRIARTIQVSRIVVAIALCAVYALIVIIIPAESYNSATEAFLASQNPFDESPSKLLCELGKYSSLINGLCAYAASKAAQGSFFVYVIWKIALSASAFYSIGAVMGLCHLGADEIRMVFTSIEKTSDDDSAQPIVKRFVCVLVALPLCLTLLFVFVDTKVADITSTQEYTAVDELIRNQAGLAVCVIDGKSYDYNAVQGFLKRLQNDSASLGQEAAETLKPLINEAFDKRIENVDKYLDWYYSLSADYECLQHLVNNTVEDFMREQMESRINDGVDDSKLNEEVARYTHMAQALESAAKEELAAYEVDVPEWLIKSKESIDMVSYELSFDTTERLIDAGTRLAVGGVAAFTINHLIAKRVIVSMMEKLAAKLGIKSGERIASISFAAAGPVGIVVKIGADVVTTIILDSAFLMVDQAMNRESYKQEIIDGINEQRNSMLALLEQKPLTE